MDLVLKQFDDILLHFTAKRTIDGIDVAITSTNKDKATYLPLGMKSTNESLTRWLRNRTIPANRAYAQNFLSKNGLSENDFIGILQICKGLSLTDCYWVTYPDDPKTFAQVNLFDNRFSQVLSQIAFTGYGSSPASKFWSSPEFTTNGMLPKAWRRKDGKVLLYKGGTSGFANLRIALTANAVTKQTRNHFGFSDPCGKTLEEYNKSSMLCCVTAAQKMNTPGFERVLAAQIFPCFTIGCWNQTKTVYDFDYEFQKMLMDTDDVAIHQDILQRLPVRDFFIPVYDSYDYNGMFVHVEFEEKEKTTAFGIVLVGPAKGSHDDFTFLTLPAWAKENQSLTEATRSTKEYLEKAAGQRQVNGISVPAVMEAVPSVFDGGTPYVRLAILCANYLASKNPDARLETSKKRDRPVFVFQGKAQRINVKTYTVGENAAKEYKKNGEGKTPRWRHYWCGNGRERRECKFIY